MKGYSWLYHGSKECIVAIKRTSPIKTGLDFVLLANICNLCDSKVGKDKIVGRKNQPNLVGHDPTCTHDTYVRRISSCLPMTGSYQGGKKELMKLYASLIVSFVLKMALTSFPCSANSVKSVEYCFRV
jgi:hypothetical protein